MLSLLKHVGSVQQVLNLAKRESEPHCDSGSIVKFKNFKRSTRRMLIKQMESLEPTLEELLDEREQWLRFFEKIHPQDFKNSCPKIAKLYKELAGHKDKNTSNEQLVMLVEQKEIPKLYSLCQKDLDLFCDNLVFLLRNVYRKNELLDVLEKNSKRIKEETKKTTINTFSGSDVNPPNKKRIGAATIKRVIGILN